MSEQRLVMTRKDFDKAIEDAKAEARPLPDPSWCDCGDSLIRGIRAGRHLPSCRYGIVLDYLDIRDPRAVPRKRIDWSNVVVDEGDEAP